MRKRPIRIRTSRFVAAAALAVVCWTPALAQETHTHGPGTGLHGLTLNAGQKWATDEHLRKAMGRIRDGMNPSIREIHQGRLAAPQYAALAKLASDEVAYMVANCKLEPKADAQLHVLIAAILEGADAMAGKSRQVTRQQGAAKVIGALESYGMYFDDPSWKPLAH
jgi:hypothetical protein